MARWRIAESLACAHLEAAGLVVLGRNVRVGRLEIDVLARERDLVVLVEVRHRGRTAYVGGLGSVDAGKRGKLRRAAERLWRERFHADPSVRALRFDVVAVTLDAGEARVEHVRGAFC